MVVSPSVLRRTYLIVYNSAVLLGWVQVLYLALKTLTESTTDRVYEAVQTPLLRAQTAAVLEVFHGLAGLVGSPIRATIPQVCSRLYVVWGILWSFPEMQTHILVSFMVISWSITEIIRYSFFGTKEAFGAAPSWLMWLRYTTFLVMYPIGIPCEVFLIYIAMPYMKESGIYSVELPNKWNFSFDYFFCSIFALGVYVPGAPHLYTYMLGQRKKTLTKLKGN